MSEEVVPTATVLRAQRHRMTESIKEVKVSDLNHFKTAQYFPLQKRNFSFPPTPNNT
jgi:hypothetical protein